VNHHQRQPQTIRRKRHERTALAKVGLTNAPDFLLHKLYTIGSLRNAETGLQLALKNRLSDAEVISLRRIVIDGGTVSLDKVSLGLSDQRVLTPSQVDSAHPLPFPLRSTVTVHTAIPGLTQGKHEIEVVFEARPAAPEGRGRHCGCGHDERTVATRRVG
jgi:hypothetical protein